MMDNKFIEAARNINQSLQQLYHDLENNEPESAALMGEHLLVEAYTLWNKNYDNASTAPDAAFTLSVTASAYCDALVAVRNPQEAYGIALGAISNIVSIESEASDSSQFNHAMLQLYIILWQSLHQILSTATSEQTPEASAHVETITRYIGSMLYHYYYAVGKKSPDNPLLSPAYQALRLISTLVKIETETITVVKLQISPTTSLPLIRDLVARSNALSLINLE